MRQTQHPLESPESSSEHFPVNKQASLLWSLGYEFPNWVGEWPVTQAQKPPLRKRLWWCYCFVQAGSLGGMAGPWKGELISLSHNLPVMSAPLRGSPNCSSACAGLFLKWRLSTGTPCYLSGLHSWKAQWLVIQWVSKTQKKFTVGIQPHRGSGQDLLEQWPTPKPAFEKPAPPKGPASALHPPHVYTVSAYLSVKALYIFSIALILTGKNCFAVCQLSCFICATQTTPQQDNT